jgi:hypothetical protein
MCSLLFWSPIVPKMFLCSSKEEETRIRERTPSYSPPSLSYLTTTMAIAIALFYLSLSLSSASV